MIALCVAIGGSTASALNGRNTVDSGDIRNGQVKTRDLARNAVTGPKVRDGALTGADIDESALGQVPSAVAATDAFNAADAAKLGGASPATFRGAASSGYQAAACTPIPTAFTNCVSTSLTLARPGQVVLTAAAGFNSYSGASQGTCQFRIDGATNSSPAVHPGEAPGDNTVYNATDGFALTRATSVLPAGVHSFSLTCKETGGDLEIYDSTISAQLVG